eukprot:COSAG02_NODE_3181_length_7215_cov_30.624930_2_plen_1762_part_00
MERGAVPTQFGRCHCGFGCSTVSHRDRPRAVAPTGWLRALLGAALICRTTDASGFPCDPENEWVELTWRSTQAATCHDCFDCSVGQVCRQRGGCFNCTAGEYDDDGNPVTPCVACPEGKTSEVAAGEEGCHEIDMDIWDAVVDGWTKLDTAMQLLIGGSLSAVVAACCLWVCCLRCEGGVTGEGGLCDLLQDALCGESDAEKAAEIEAAAMVKAARDAAHIKRGEPVSSEDDDEEMGPSVGTQRNDQVLPDTVSLIHGDVPSDESAQVSTLGKRCHRLSCCYWKGGENNASPDGNAYDLIPDGEMPAAAVDRVRVITQLNSEEPEPEAELEPEPKPRTEPEPEPEEPRSAPEADQAARLRKATSLPHPEPEPELLPDTEHPFKSCLDRPYVQKELRWAQQYQKKVIVVFEKDERRAGFFDHGKARYKYKGTEWEYILDIDAIPYQRDDDYADVMVAKIIKKAARAVGVATPPSMNEPGWWDFFLSHAQATGGDQSQTTSLRLKAKGKTVWYDNAMQDRSTGAMEEGVRCCGCVVLFLTGTPDEADASPADAETVPEPEPAAVEILPKDDQATRDEVYVAFREGGAEWGQQLQSQLLIPHGGLPLELPPGIRVVVTVLLDAEAPLLKHAEDPLRQLLARIFHPDSRLIVVPVVDAAFTVDHFDGLPDEIRALARQQLVVMDAARPEQAIQSIQTSTRHARTEHISATLRNYLDTVIKETESFRDPCTQEELSTETQCVPLRAITLKQWSDSMKSAYERSDASDLMIIRRRHGYGDSVGYADRLGGNGDREHREADVHFAEAKRSSTEVDLMPGAVILGPAACGKTTLLNRTACGYARDALCGYLGALVPYVIRVMELSSWLIKNDARLLEEADIILEFICHKCGGKRSGLYSQLEQLFEDGNLCLIFDGLDEAGKKLQEIGTCIGVTLGNSYSGRLIVSSRESLFDEGHFKQSRWNFLQIQPLTERMQLDVLQRRFGGDVLKVSAFQEAQAHSVNLLEMGSNPLLLALMIGVFIIDKNRLPDRRTELYEKGVQMMVRGASRNAKAAAAVLSPSKQPKSKGRGRGRGRGKRKAPKMDVQDQTLFALLSKIGHYLHVTKQKRDFQIFEITELVADLDWDTVSAEQVLDAWTDLQTKPRGLFLCTEVDPDGDGDAEKDWHRSTHLTFQEFFGAKQCVTEARAADSVADYFEETFTASPNPWLREVLLMATEMLSADEFEQVAKFYLDADDGSGACSVRVDQMLESRREDRSKGVGARITARLSQTRSVETMAKALRHPCEELRDLALTEIEKFRMPKEQVAARLVDLAKPESAAACPWYNHLAGIQSLGKLQVKHEAVISTLIRIGLDRSGMREVIETAVRAIKTLEQENSDVVAAKVVELLNGTPEDQQFIWTTVIKSIQIEHQLVIGTLRDTMGSNTAVKAYLDLLDGVSPEFEPEPEPESELETESTELQQIAETRSRLTALGITLTEPGSHAEEKIKAVAAMFDAVNDVVPVLMKDAKELTEQGGEFQAELMAKLSDLDDEQDVGATLCWATQETAVATLQAAADGRVVDEAPQAFACISAFDTALRNQSTLVLGIALNSVIGASDDDDDDEMGSSEDGGFDEDPFIERLLGRLEASCPFAFSPLLHYFRAVLDPGTDPTGERGEALRQRVDGRLQRMGPLSVEGIFLRKELQVGKYELEQPFWIGKIDLQTLRGSTPTLDTSEPERPTHAKLFDLLNLKPATTMPEELTATQIDEYWTRLAQLKKKYESFAQSYIKTLDE